ncbi:MAG: RNA methyltransferase [Prevotella sp.]|nr:RNA methyltransferase [Prevotella sp.]
MISKGRIKSVRQLELKKFRRQTGLFVAEGPKVVGDLLEVMPPQTIIATEAWMGSHALPVDVEAVVVDEDELRRVSFLQHPQQVLGIFRQPIVEERMEESAAHIARHLCIALDGIQDPGNMGTIIRIADWFGIDTIYCSASTADAYSPKVVQSTMGSIARVRIVTTDLVELARQLPVDVPVYGTVLDGDNIYSADLKDQGLLVMGNEGNGITPEMRALLTHRLLIPHYPEDRRTADSLNVAIATAITCAEFRRNRA